jgi:ketosteroid isomerase-like protein
MLPSETERDQLFKTFGRAFFKQDLDLMFTVVTPDFAWIAPAAHDDVHTVTARGREEIAQLFARRRGVLANARFHDVVYHHASDASFMTYRLTATVAATGEALDTVGVERYTFRDGRLAVKDVYYRRSG